MPRDISNTFSDWLAFWHLGSKPLEQSPLRKWSFKLPKNVLVSAWSMHNSCKKELLCWPKSFALLAKRKFLLTNKAHNASFQWSNASATHNHFKFHNKQQKSNFKTRKKSCTPCTYSHYYFKPLLPPPPPQFSTALSHLLTAVNFSAMEYQFLAHNAHKNDVNGW